MGVKKLKKDEKTPAEDVLETVLFESHQPETVCLMLESPEPDVQAKACESIYKFASKCEENKKSLLDIGVCPGLLKLVAASEERLIRRNASMALAILSESPEIRKELRKNDQLVAIFLKLLNPLEEFNTTIEFAAMTLANLCQEYACIADVLECSGSMEALVECLRQEDPDVQKHAITCLNLICQDFEARVLLRDVAGLEPMLELLKSEFPVIQQITLETFAKASLDSNVRQAMRELQCIRQFIEIVGKPEMNDIHIHSLHVISNCLEDIECAKQIKESLSLNRLLAFVADQHAVDEDLAAGGGGAAGPGGKADKGSAKKGAKGGSAGKKGAAKKKGDDSPTGKDGEPGAPSHTLPEVKVFACHALMKASKLDEIRRVLHEVELEKSLVLLLSHEAEPVRVAACQALGVMAQSGVSKDTIMTLDAAEPLIKLLKSEHKEPRSAAAYTLANLTAGSSAYICQEFLSRHGVEYLIGALAMKSEQVCSNALSSLINMSTGEEQVRSKALGNGLVAALVNLRTSQSALVQTKMAQTVANYVCDAKYRAEFRELKGCEVLIGWVDSNHADVRKAAAWAIACLVQDFETAEEFNRLQGIQRLQAVLNSETKKNRFAEVALKKMYSHNLILKYAYTHQLDFTDQIGDEFFDVGRLKSEDLVKSIHEYGLEPVNQKRPIFVFNLKPPKVVSPASTMMIESETRTVSEKTSKKTGAGKGLRSRANSKGKLLQKTSTSPENRRGSSSNTDAIGNGVTDAPIEEDEELKISAPSPMAATYTVPDDPGLLRCVEEVLELSSSGGSGSNGSGSNGEVGQPAFGCTVIEQISSLARMVSQRMGGRINPSDLMSFNFELHFSELKVKLRSNVIPIGFVSLGIFVHRALLFKFLADKIGLPVNLCRGDYNRAWNEVWLLDPAKPDLKIPPKLYIVDLMYDPGRLIPTDSAEGISYKKL